MLNLALPQEQHKQRRGKIQNVENVFGRSGGLM